MVIKNYTVSELVLFMIFTSTHYMRVKICQILHQSFTIPQYFFLKDAYKNVSNQKCMVVIYLQFIQNSSCLTKFTITYTCSSHIRRKQYTLDSSRLQCFWIHKYNGLQNHLTRMNSSNTVCYAKFQDHANSGAQFQKLE